MKSDKRLSVNWVRIWYMLCFFALGIIDQRRGSARGEIQMAAANTVGLVIAAMLLPSLHFTRFKNKIYVCWTVLAVIGGAIACIWGWNNWLYKGQWVSAVLVAVVWGYLILYIFRERKELSLRKKVLSPVFLCVECMFLFMCFSVREDRAPLMLLILFGGFYIIGIPGELRKDFFQGMLNGIILWFFVQQIIAFGFRPYDYVRYRGLYAGETQNGLFYMIAYCAFLVKWLWTKDEKRYRIWSWLCFFLAAGCVSFTLYTGGRSPMMGIGLATAVIFIWYDIAHRKSFYRFLLHGILWLVCLAVTFPMVYGCIRYLPTVLHHPIWFEGNYNEYYSVVSSDPWDSEKYVPFKLAVETNVGRLFSAIGINITEWMSRITGSADMTKVDAKELNEPGDTSENPFTLPGAQRGSAIDVRKVIHAYCIQHLNWRGHSKDRPGFYIIDGTLIDHAHNMFLEIGYNHGIPAGILFIVIYIYSILRAFRRRRLEGMLCVTFLLAILAYGMFEMAVVPGQITVVLMGLLFYFAGEMDRNSEMPAETAGS